MKPFAILAVAAMFSPVAFAQRQTFVVNPEASEIKMTLNTTHEVVNGTFRVQHGSVQFDRGNSKMAGFIAVLAGSGKTGNDSRDRKMDRDILDVDRYSIVSFEPGTYLGTLAPAGDSEIQVKGIFTLLGTPHEITVPMRVHLEGSSATAKAHFVVPYVQWGLKNPSFMIWKADNDVAIDVNLVGMISK